ncbi:hypothetical protein ACSFCT_25330, partial [Yokenella regensburgei]
ETLNWLCLTGIPPEPDSAWAQDDKAGKARPANRATLLTQMRVQVFPLAPDSDVGFVHSPPSARITFIPAKRLI